MSIKYVGVFCRQRHQSFACNKLCFLKLFYSRTNRLIRPQKEALAPLGLFLSAFLCRSKLSLNLPTKKRSLPPSPQSKHPLFWLLVLELVLASTPLDFLADRWNKRSCRANDLLSIRSTRKKVTSLDTR